METKPINIQRVKIKQSDFDCDKITYGKLTENKQYGYSKVYLHYDKSAFIVDGVECSVMFCKKHVSDTGRISYNLGVKYPELEMTGRPGTFLRRL